MIKSELAKIYRETDYTKVRVRWFFTKFKDRTKPINSDIVIYK